jgi:hypothetical protein
MFAVLVPATALAKGPKVTSFAPKSPELGGKLTLRGGPFAAKKSRNTVVMRAPNGGSTFIKPRKAGRRKLVLRLPGTLERLFKKRSGRSVATRFRVRILTGRKFGPWTKKMRSPVVRPSGAGTGGTADCDNDGLPNSADPNDDNDLLDDDLEHSIKTDICLADSDQDGIQDGWEYWAAKDLNLRAVPYPGKRPFPNALDPSDVNVDFDGDSLVASEEYLAWKYTGSAFDASMAGPGPESPLYYSDGTQRSRLNPPDITVPQWRGGEYGVPTPGEPFPAQLDQDGDGAYQDDERDADADGLNNFIETHGPGSSVWWSAQLGAEGVAPWPGPAPTPEDPDGVYWGEYTERPFLNLWGPEPVADPTGMVNPDSDGDTLLDGEDDQDNDDVNNVLEMYFRTVVDSADNEFPTNAFNPCAPDRNSRTCDRHPPIGG